MKVRILSKNGHGVVDLDRKTAIRESGLNWFVWSPSEVVNCALESRPYCGFIRGREKQHPEAWTKGTGVT
jgi:hypothetical protein